MPRWKKGILSEDLRSYGGSVMKKGSEVKYIRMKAVTFNDVWEYEWHYQPINGGDYIRTHKRTIDGLPLIKEESKYEKRKRLENGNT